MNFMKPEDVFKFIDDTQFIEVLNLIAIGLSSWNFRKQVASDISTNNQFLPPENFQTSSHLQKIEDWTKNQEMCLNNKKSKYMIFNFCHSKQFQTRLKINETVIEQVKETKLLGVILADDLS